MKKNRASSSRYLWLFLMMAFFAVGAVSLTSCGSDADEEAATSVDKKIKKVWHSKGYGLPSHLKDICLDLTTHGKIKVYVKYVDSLQHLLGLEDVWYEGEEYNYSTQYYYDNYGDHVSLSLDDGFTVAVLRNVKLKETDWYHYDYAQNVWMDCLLEPYEQALNAKKLPCHDVLTTIVGQWLIDDGEEKNCLKYYSAYGDYMVINVAPFYIDDKGQFKYGDEAHTLGVQNVEGGCVEMSFFDKKARELRITLTDSKHAEVYNIEDDAVNFLYKIIRQDIQAIK